ncbi:MAG: hypothetical protein JNJ84_14460, partial [Rhodobacteraceae bacterium]|nr:hypothetical protein [Paracoccaceae bacterium]
IGLWTAEIYAMFALGRADVFAPGDLALQEGARHLFGLPDRPTERALRAMAEASDEDLRAAGLSRQKARYGRALAQSGIDFDALREMPDAEVVRVLTAVPGIGLWTAEIYAMFALGRADVFAPGDLALQEGARHLFGLPERPTERALRAMAEDWSPWRAVAARALWAYYRVIRAREGIR